MAGRSNRNRKTPATELWKTSAHASAGPVSVSTVRLGRAMRCFEGLMRGWPTHVPPRQAMKLRTEINALKAQLAAANDTLQRTHRKKVKIAERARRLGDTVHTMTAELRREKKAVEDLQKSVSQATDLQAQISAVRSQNAYLELMVRRQAEEKKAEQERGERLEEALMRTMQEHDRMYEQAKRSTDNQRSRWIKAHRRLQAEHEAMQKAAESERAKHLALEATLREQEQDLGPALEESEVTRKGLAGHVQTSLRELALHERLAASAWPAPQQLCALPLDAVQAIHKQVRALHERVCAAIARQTRCCKCQDQCPDTVLLPCEHPVLCSRCAVLLRTCPSCGTAVTGSRKLPALGAERRSASPGRSPRFGSPGRSPRFGSPGRSPRSGYLGGPAGALELPKAKRKPTLSPRALSPPPWCPGGIGTGFHQLPPKTKSPTAVVKHKANSPLKGSFNADLTPGTGRTKSSGDPGPAPGPGQNPLPKLDLRSAVHRTSVADSNDAREPTSGSESGATPSPRSISDPPAITLITPTLDKADLNPEPCPDTDSASDATSDTTSDPDPDLDPTSEPAPDALHVPDPDSAPGLPHESNRDIGPDPDSVQDPNAKPHSSESPNSSPRPDAA